MEPVVGVEPTTFRLQGGCSTTELHRRTANHDTLDPARSYPGGVPLLIAEELLLVTVGPNGKGPARGTEVDCALGGALLVELVLDGQVELDGKVVRRSQTPVPPSAPMLREAADGIAGRPRRPKAVVSRLRKGARRRVLAGLVSSGALADERYRWLGLITRRRYPVADAHTRDEVMGRLREAVLDGQPPSPRTAALASMVSAGKLERRVFPDADRRQVRRRLREIAEGEWAAKAVRDAIAAIHSATVAAAVAASSSATTSGGSV